MPGRSVLRLGRVTVNENESGNGTGGGPPEDLLVPPAMGRGPGVMVLHSGRGLTEFIQSFCNRLAREGFTALAVDLFEGETPQSIESAAAAKASVADEELERALVDSASFLRSHRTVSRKQIGVIGLGYGAEWACFLAGAIPGHIGAVTLFYGYDEVDWVSVTAPVLGHFAERDPEYPPSTVDSLRESMKAADVYTDFFVYTDTKPSFFEDEPTAEYDPRAARLAWDRTTSFLKQNLQPDVVDPAG